MRHFALEGFPATSPRCTELVSSTAGIKHSPLPRAMFCFDFPWGSPVSSAELQGHLFAQLRLPLERSGVFWWFCWLPGQPEAPAACSVHVHPRTHLPECLATLGSHSTFLISHLSAPQPADLLHSVIWVFCLRVSSCLVLVLTHPC